MTGNTALIEALADNGISKARDLDNLTNSDVRAISVKVANAAADGLVSILRFTTGWKAFFGTPDVAGSDRERIYQTRTARSEYDALGTCSAERSSDVGVGSCRRR